MVTNGRHYQKNLEMKNMNTSDNKIEDKNKINDTTQKKKETDLKENLKQNQELGQHKIKNNKIKTTSIQDQNNINTNYNNLQNNKTEINQIVSYSSNVQEKNKYESPKKIITFNWIRFLKLLAVVLIFSAVIFVALKFIFDITAIWALIVFSVVPVIIFLACTFVFKNKFRKICGPNPNMDEISTIKNDKELLKYQISLKKTYVADRINEPQIYKKSTRPYFEEYKKKLSNEDVSILSIFD